VSNLHTSKIRPHLRLICARTHLGSCWRNPPQSGFLVGNCRKKRNRYVNGLCILFFPPSLLESSLAGSSFLPCRALFGFAPSGWVAPQPTPTARGICTQMSVKKWLDKKE
jgi:hypothetical protein